MQQINYLKYILDKQIHWISVADTKSSIMLSVLGVITPLLINSKRFINILYYANNLNINYKTLSYMLYFVIILGIIFIISSGILFLLTLIPRLKINKYQKIKDIKKSHIYFKDIANNSKNSLNKYFMNLNDPREELVNQIYINAKIANRKMILCNIGLTFSLPIILIIFIIII